MELFYFVPIVVQSEKIRKKGVFSRLGYERGIRGGGGVVGGSIHWNCVQALDTDMAVWPT